MRRRVINMLDRTVSHYTRDHFTTACFKPAQGLVLVVRCNALHAHLRIGEQPRSDLLSMFRGISTSLK